MENSVQHDIMRLVVRGMMDLLLHHNADMIEIFEERNRPDLITAINTFESSFMWLRKQLENENA